MPVQSPMSTSVEDGQLDSLSLAQKDLEKLSYNENTLSPKIRRLHYTNRLLEMALIS